MKYVLTYEAHTGAVSSDRKPDNYDWYGVDMTASDVPVSWKYPAVPLIKRKIKNREAWLKAKKDNLKKRSKQDRANKAFPSIDNDLATFARNTNTPGKAG
jgi:hypothetical protein